MNQPELLSEAIAKINTASEALIRYYKVLEDRIRLLTEEVEEKKRLLSSIIDSIDIAVVFFDRDGIIKLINRSAESLFKISASDVIGKRELPIEIKDDMVYPLNSQKPFYAIVSQSQVLDSEGNQIGKVLLCKDITRIKELEAENERNRRLTAMGSLLMKIAHEIRNPLGSIELFSNMIAEDLKETIHGEYARRISSAVSMLRNTLENMLSYTRGITLKRERFLLSEMLSSVVEEFREFFNRAGIEISFLSDDDYYFFGDSALLRQAIINLLVNAYQAMPEGGRIEVSLTGENSSVKITVKDTGQGIDSSVIGRIFEPFFSTKDRGSGLGLSITNSIVKAHNGRIEVKSQTGVGTEFAIYLPLE